MRFEADGIARRRGRVAALAAASTVLLASALEPTLAEPRLNGVIWLSDVGTDRLEGARLQGNNFQDHAGSSLTRVADLDGDGQPEFIIGARFGKPYNINPGGNGFGEAYLIFGTRQRLDGTIPLNSVGELLAGVTFPGIRAPVDTGLTDGLTAIATIPDIDGDGRPELVFGFPATNSISLSDVSVLQVPDRKPDLAGLGTLEAGFVILDRYFPFGESTRIPGDRTVISDNDPRRNGPAFVAPAAIALDGFGGLLVLDSGAVMRVSTSSNGTTGLTGDRIIVSGTDLGNPGQTVGQGAEFVAPVALTSGAAGVVYVVDRGVAAIIRVDAPTQFATAAAAVEGAATVPLLASASLPPVGLTVTITTTTMMVTRSSSRRA